MTQQNLANFIWPVADLPRGDFKRFESGRVILPFFDTTDFAYGRITVERPLQIAFEPANELRRQALQADKGWDMLGADRQRAARRAGRHWRGPTALPHEVLQGHE